jgi:hypothetical protein
MSGKLSNILAGNLSKKEAHPEQVDSISLHCLQMFQMYILVFLEDLFEPFFLSVEAYVVLLRTYLPNNYYYETLNITQVSV